jgi:hypothetical protein
MDEQISSEAEKAQMELQVKDAYRRKVRIAEFVGGIVLWLVVGLLVESNFNWILFIIALLNWLLIVVFLFKRRWIAFGMLTAYSLNILIAWLLVAPNFGDQLDRSMITGFAFFGVPLLLLFMLF